MSAIPLSPAALPRPGATTDAAIRSTKAARALTLALLAVLLYGAFAHGGVDLAANARIEVALSAIAAVAGIAWLWTGTLRLSASRIAAAGAASLGLFAAWSGVSLLWSVAPDETWIELNRAIGYVLALGLAVMLGASQRNAVSWIGNGFAGIAALVACYALGQKAIPGLHVGGLIDLNQTGQLPRLQQPLGYWNALALFLVLAVPIVLALAVDMERARRTRSVGLVTLQLMLLTIGLTYSRGGLIALVVALVIAVGLSGVRLRSLMWLGIAALAAIAPLVFGLTSHSLTTVRSSLASRESAGLILLLILLASITGLLIAARSLHDLEARRRLSPAQARGIGKVLVGVSVVLLAAGVLALALSARGLGGSVSHAWHTFTATRVTSNYDPGRLLSADSENRWVWWKEAAGAFSDRPLTGWGAGSFPVVHLLYRHNRLSVNQPHSVPLQFLSEIGLPGLLFAAVGFAFLIAQAVRGIRALPVGRGRLVPAALLAGAVAYLVHSLYDWDWNFPALTLPALIFLGVLAAHRPRGVTASRSSATARGVLLATATVCLCLVAISALLPSLAASKSSAALVSASNASADAVQDAQASAQLASSLDPLSDNGLKLEATIALRRGSVAAAVRYLVAAVNRDPSDVEAWQQIAYLESVHGNFPAALRAVRRLLVLDPRGRETNVLVASVVAAANLANAPPAGSATAQPVP